MPSSQASNRVRELREARGVSQVALAASAQLSRQSVGAIEAGRATPAVDVALRIARALDCPIEELFGATSPEARVWAEPAAAVSTGRVALAHIAGRWVAHPLAGDGLRTSADGLVCARVRDRLEVASLRASNEARENVIVTGCAPALGLLADRLNARPGAGRFLWFSGSSTRALDALERAQTHVAGVHLTDAKTGEANLAEVRRRAKDRRLSVFTLARWQAGLIVAAGNPKQIRGVADLARRGLRLVTREAGSGALQLLTRELRRAGLPVELARAATLSAPGHLEVAQSIALGAADVGIATRDAALAFGLELIPLAEERYDLVVAQSELADPRLQRMLDTMTTSAYRRELSALGYDVRSCGERVAELSAS